MMGTAKKAESMKAVSKKVPVKKAGFDAGEPLSADKRTVAKTNARPIQGGQRNVKRLVDVTLEFRGIAFTVRLDAAGIKRTRWTYTLPWGATADGIAISRASALHDAQGAARIVIASRLDRERGSDRE